MAHLKKTFKLGFAQFLDQPVVLLLVDGRKCQRKQLPEELSESSQRHSKVHFRRRKRPRGRPLWPRNWRRSFCVRHPDSKYSFSDDTTASRNLRSQSDYDAAGERKVQEVLCGERLQGRPGHNGPGLRYIHVIQAELVVLLLLLFLQWPIFKTFFDCNLPLQRRNEYKFAYT